MSASEPPRRSKRKATTAPNYVDSEGEEDGSQRSPNENAVTSPGLLADVSPAKRAKRSASPSKAPQTPAKTRPIKAPPTEPATRGASSSRSPRTPGSAKPAKVTKPPPTDPSTWRNSRIRPRTTISKGNAAKQYRLKPSDLEDIPYVTHPTASGFIAHLVNERAVERKAWAKHGSPEGWDAHLDIKRAQHYAKSPGKLFSEPASTFRGVTLMGDPSQAGIFQPPLLPPSWNVLQQRFPARWLWDACLRHVEKHNMASEFGIPTEGKLEMMERALLNGHLPTLRNYPSRPAHSLPPSPAVDNLRIVLERAPRTPANWQPDDRDVDPALEHLHDGFTDHDWLDWGASFCDEIYAGLIGVIEEVGTSDQGWKSIRWEVYDKYADYIEGVEYARDNRDSWWVDNAHFWLRGRLDATSKDIDWQRRKKTELGRMYNDLLLGAGH